MLTELFHEQPAAPDGASEATLRKFREKRQEGTMLLLRFWMRENWKAEFIFVNEVRRIEH